MTDKNPNIAFQPLPTRRNFVNITGRTFRRLTVLGLAFIRDERSYWFCECACGNICKVRGDILRAGTTQSCGCLRIDFPPGLRHGDTQGGRKLPEYRAYDNAKTRCHNANHKAYARYGGRGIEFRFTSYEEFLAEVGRKPSPKHSLDRFPDNDGHYEPGNVRWATRSQQANNRNGNILLTYDGQTLSVTEWSRLMGVPRGRMEIRLRWKWCVPCTLTLPLHKSCKHHK